jgi:hypothetical protein
MAKIRDRRKNILEDLEVTPRALLSVPAGSDGQLAPVTDVSGVNLMVRIGGVLVPAVDVAANAAKIDQTTSDIDMVVNSATGTSPPAGTIVRSQAEYAALGYDLKYPQDAIDILPIGLGHFIEVTLKAGNSLAKPDDTGFTGMSQSLQAKPFIQTTLRNYSDVNPDYVSAAIWFKGESKNILVSEIAGTFASTGDITAVGTSWVTDAYRGKLLLIKTGANAGSIVPVSNNTDTVIKTTPGYWSAGACTFEVYEPTSIWLDSTDGVNPDAYGIEIRPDCMAYICFGNIQFGTAALPSYGITGGTAPGQIRASVVTDSIIINNNTVWGPAIYGSSFKFNNCSIRVVSSTYAAFFLNAQDSAIWLTRCFVYGYPTGYSFTNSFFCGFYRGICINLDSTVVAPDTGWNKFVIFLSGSFLTVRKTIIQGNTVCGGIQINDIQSYQQSYMYSEVQINNCVTALDVAGAPALVLMGGTVSGSGNTNGWVLSRGSRVRSENPANVGATTEMTIDGIAHSYSEIPNKGDGIMERYGSSLEKI